jgi:hypothetical protein
MLLLLSLVCVKSLTTRARQQPFVQPRFEIAVFGAFRNMLRTGQHCLQPITVLKHDVHTTDGNKIFF